MTGQPAQPLRMTRGAITEIATSHGLEFRVRGKLHVRLVETAAGCRVEHVEAGSARLLRHRSEAEQLGRRIVRMLTA